MSSIQVTRPADPTGNALLPGLGITRPRTRHTPPIGRTEIVDRLHGELGALFEKCDEADARVKAAKAAETEADAGDLVADIDRVAAGQEPLPATKRTLPAAQREHAEALRQQLIVYRAAAKKAAEHDRAVIADRDTLLAAAEADDATAGEAVRVALAALQKAANRLSETRGAVRWYGDVTSRDVPLSVSRAQINVKVGSRNDLPINDVLAGLRAASDPPTGPKTRTATPGESTFSSVPT